MADKLIAEYKVVGGNTTRLYENRIEIHRKILGMELESQSVTIPIAAISNVTGPQVRPMRKLTITTIDGKVYQPVLYYQQQLDFKKRLEQLI